MCNQKIVNVLKNVYTEVRDRSLFIAWRGGGRAEDFGGRGHLIFRRTKVASVVTENPKGGLLKTLDGLRGGGHQICLENEDMGGSRKSSNVIRGITSVK